METCPVIYIYNNIYSYLIIMCVSVKEKDTNCFIPEYNPRSIKVGCF